MAIDRDDGGERQARTDQMIKEFREAQSRRLGKRKDKVAEITEATWLEPRSGSTPTPARKDGNAR